MDYFDTLGGLVHRLWHEQHLDAEHFPAVATRAFTELPPHACLSVQDIVTWAMGTNTMPPQLDLRSQFGEPPLTVYNDGGVVIDVYFWLDGSTTIHQHAFAGAFFVLQGASVETLYDFHRTHCYNAYLQTGELRIEEVRLNTQGTCHPIHPGQQLIHRLFHLDKPSVSIVIRTDAPWALPQYEYWWPCIAIQPATQASPLQQRRLEVLNMLGSCQPTALLPHLQAYLTHGAPEEVLWGLDNTRQFFVGRLDELNDLLRHLKHHHGSLIEQAIRVFKQNARTAAIVALRKTVADPELRLLLGLFLNVRNRQQLLDLVSEYFPDRKPLEATLTLLRRLFENRGLCQNTTVLPQHLRGPLTLSILQGVLEGLTVGQLQARLLEHHRTPPEAVRTTYEGLQTSLLFSILFERGRVTLRSAS